MSSQQLGSIVGAIVALLLSAVFIWYVWVWPVRAGIRVARRKGRSPHWMWFGIHPLGGWIAFAVLSYARPRKVCPQCSESSPLHARNCPYCSFEFDLSAPISGPGVTVEHGPGNPEREARVILADSWTTAGPDSLDRAGGVLRELLLRWNMEVESDQAGTHGVTILASQGSEAAMRILGGWFIAPRVLPKAVRVELRAIEGGIHVAASVRETFGFGFLDRRTKRKYEEYFQLWMAALRKVLPAALPQVPN